MPYRITGNKAVDELASAIDGLIEAEEENRRIGYQMFKARMAMQDALLAICLKEGIEYPWVPKMVVDAEDDIQEAGHAPSRD